MITDSQGVDPRFQMTFDMKLAELLLDWDERAPGWRPKEMSKETEEGLKALGYVE